MTTRDTARQAWERRPITIVEMDFETCVNVYGQLPCTASGGPGSECYNTRPTCQDVPNYIAGIKTLKVCNQGCPIPPGETLFPYLDRLSASSTKLDPEKGLARRAKITLDMVDEAIADTWQDPYINNRSQPAASTFWRRFMARNRAYVGKLIRLRRGYEVNPWDWTVFQDELYAIDTITGPKANGKLQVIAKDPVKIVDNVKLPAPSSSKLVSDLPEYDDVGIAQGGSAFTIVLQQNASAVDDYYTGMAVRISDRKGAGQERVITAYVAATRTASIDNYWLVAPDDTSVYFIQRLELEVDQAGASYDIYGVPGWVRIGKEIIKFTQRVDNVISWPDTSYRQQFDTPLEDHKKNNLVQVCKVFTEEKYTDVLTWLYTESGLDISYIDVAGFADIDTIWLGQSYLITAPLSVTKRASDYVQELLQQAGCILWWSPQEQLLKLTLVAPPTPGITIPTLKDNDGLIEGSVDVEALDAIRLTTSAMYFSRVHGTADLRDASNFLRGDVYDDDDARQEYGDERVEIYYSRWFGDLNDQAVKNFTARSVTNRRVSPLLIKARIDPKDYDFNRGDFRDIETNQIVDETGQPKLTRALITNVEDHGGYIKIEGRSTIFTRRFGFFAPDGTPNYPDNNGYACFCNNDGTMPDGSEGYLFY